MKDRDCIGCVYIIDCPGAPGGEALCLHRMTQEQKEARDKALEEKEKWDD